jgi:hypothetical protein
MKTSALSMVGVALLVAALAAPAFADQGKGNDSRTENRSACGAAHAADANVNGNFGWLGQDHGGGTPGYHDGATGQDPGATGYNNSHTDCQNA